MKLNGGMEMDGLYHLLGKVIAENTSESMEVTLLKQKLVMHIEKLTQDHDTIANINSLLDTVLCIAQKDSKFEGFIAGMNVADSDIHILR